MIDFFLCSNKYRIAATNTINLSLRVYYIPSFSIAPSLRGDLMRRFTFYAASVYRSSYFRWFPPISTIWNLCTFSGFYMCLCHTDWESVESTHLNFFYELPTIFICLLFISLNNVSCYSEMFILNQDSQFISFIFLSLPISIMKCIKMRYQSIELYLWHRMP